MTTPERQQFKNQLAVLGQNRGAENGCSVLRRDDGAAYLAELAASGQRNVVDLARQKVRSLFEANHENSLDHSSLENGWSSQAVLRAMGACAVAPCEFGLPVAVVVDAEAATATDETAAAAAWRLAHFVGQYEVGLILLSQAAETANPTVQNRYESIVAAAETVVKDNPGVYGVVVEQALPKQEIAAA